MATRGTPIGGWWSFWPYHGEQYARNFKTFEDAVAYLPTIKVKAGKPFPLGPKWVMEVKWDYDNNEWSYNPPVVYTQEQVEEQFIEQGEARGLPVAS